MSLNPTSRSQIELSHLSCSQVVVGTTSDAVYYDNQIVVRRLDGKLTQVVGQLVRVPYDRNVPASLERTDIVSADTRRLQNLLHENRELPFKRARLELETVNEKPESPSGSRLR